MNRFRKKVLVWFFIVAALFLIELSPWAKRPFAPLIKVSASVEAGFYAGKRAVSLFLERVILGQETATRLSDLESRLSTISLDQAHLASLQEENNNLRTILNFKEIHSINTVTTKIISEDPRAPAQLRLAAGSQNGVRSGAAVISPDGALVGIISETGPDISVVRLLEHRLTQLPVRILNKDTAFGLLESSGGLSLRMTQIPKDADVKVHDVVVTSFVHDRVPSDLVVGTVISIENDPQGLWQEAVVAPMVEPSTLDIVAIVSEL